MFMYLLIRHGVTGSAWLCFRAWSFMVPHLARINDHWSEFSLLQVTLLWILNPNQKPLLTTHHGRGSGFVNTSECHSTGCSHLDIFPGPTIFQLLWLLQKELTAVMEVLFIQHIRTHLCMDKKWGLTGLETDKDTKMTSLRLTLT